MHIDGNNGDSRFGVRGSEALGGGMTAFFDIQHRFGAENGLTDSNGARSFWHGKSTVGLQGGFGKVEIGRQLTAFQGPVGAQDPFGVSTAGSVHVLGSYVTDAQTNGGGGRTDIINYSTPNISGFSGALGFAPKTTAVSGAISDRANAITSLWAGYAAGPLNVGAGTEKNREGDKIVAGLATYNFGVAKLFLGAQQTDTVAKLGAKEKAFNIGATAPFGPVLVKAGFKSSKAETTGAKSTKVGFGVDYALSPRTFVSANMGNTKTSNTKIKGSGYDLFVQHSF
jgi:predicted porin